MNARQGDGHLKVRPIHVTTIWSREEDVDLDGRKCF